MSTVAPSPQPRRRRGRTASVVLGAGAVAVILGGAVIPYPYVIESPGPTYDVLKEDVIQVAGRPTYPATGSLSMTTVYLTGGPGQDVHGFDILGAWLRGDSRIVPEREIFPGDTTPEEIAHTSRLEMTNSQNAAVAAAYTRLGIPYQKRLVVQALVKGAPAAGVLKDGDQILAAGGGPVADVVALRKAVEASEGKPVALTVLRDGARRELTVKPVKQEQRWVLGVYLKNDFTFPFTPTFNLRDVGGPSAGMMFALGLLEELTPGDQTNGHAIAGTGTIQATGEVGPIGGIQQKMIGASRSGARYFLAPAANCGDVVGHVPSGMEVVRVATLEQAAAAVTAIGRGETRESNPQALPTCG
ncbi:PDZ domain-containing protein [Falsarthrobacter nasiphocae]|uniref:endopeptidase La n=1 Tax=Falsarthrobacter nasiphocae TaxID=189863 RepID=A0AAE4C6F7_9MICC|nr:S16 family serine protease [Falsarthrobacter nasiphocae]MDR6891444.1 PDZ domain-containing protein [Falsarthrobacter nasiphocae]